MVTRLLDALFARAAKTATSPSGSLAEVTCDNLTNGVVVPDPSAPVYEGHQIPAYPDRGIAAPAVPPEMLIASQRKQIDALHQVSSFSRQDFDAYILPAIHRYASYVHLLPASESQHHCGQGGLFRHGLEVAYNAALACEGKVFAFDHWASERDKLVPRWRMCAILGGMIHDMGKPIIDVGAVDSSGNLIWNPHACSLHQWLVENNLSEYYIRWRPGARHKRHEAFNALSLYRIVPDETLRWITDHGGQEPLDDLVMALAGTSNPNNPLASLIKQADSKSVSKDIKDSRARMAASGMGGANSLAIRLIRAMHDLIQEGTWEINRVGASPIWVTTEGLFGLTEEVIKGAVGVLRDQGESSLPNDYRETLNLLADWGYLHTNIQANGQQFLTWEIRIYAMDRGKPIEFNAHVIRFTKEELLPRAMIPPEPVRAVILGRDGAPLSSGGIQGSQPTSAPVTAASPAPPAKAPEARAPSQQDGLEPSLDEFAAPPVREPDDSAVLLLGANEGEALLLQSGMAEADERVDLMNVDESTAAAPIRDRSAEPDPRDQQMLEARQQTSKKWPPESPEAAATYFRAQGTEGAIVITLTSRVSSGDLKEGDDVWEIHDKVYFRYPEAFAGLGIEQADIRDMLEAKGWTERDQNTPNRSTVVLPGSTKRVSTLRFNENISQAILMLLPARDGRSVGKKQVDVHKRLLPLGPFLDVDVAVAIDGKSAADEADSYLIRAGFHQYILQSLDAQDRSPSELNDSEIRHFATVFAKQHRVSGQVWVIFHLTRGNNPWAVKSLASKNNQLEFNTKYSFEQDLADKEAKANA